MENHTTGAQSLKKGQKIKGYQVIKTEPLPTIGSELILLVHEQTKATHIHIANKDKENTFGVFFRTVPKDSTGVAHILEHTVLCGSEKFKVRDPFFSMIKRSLSTFMNAFTASDWTMYPFSSQNRKDYYNLMDVYLDAAFFPNIDELSFRQEGHRLDIVPGEGDSVELEYKGVVYNEMKGAMSSPGQVLGRSLMAGLYPDTTYSNNSGGEPSDIPSLTWQGLRDFHAEYYHPSNAFFYTYGDLPLQDTLEFISQKALDRFDFLEVDSAVSPQPRWDAPRTRTQAYPFSDLEEIDKKYQGCVAWLTCDIRDSFEILVLAVLEQILLGNSASPLRKALIDSKLGSALSDSSGFDPDNRDTMFSCGLKDITKDSVKKVEDIIFSTLNNLADNGIDKRLIESAIHQIEFHRKEITNTPYPFGIKLLLTFAGTMIHGGDPVACINIDDDIKRLKALTDQGPFLENKIKAYFIDNPHRLLFTLEPDPDLENRELDRIKAELAARLKALTPEDIEQINAQSKALEALQEQEEDVTVLPTLELSDVPPEIEMIRPDRMDGVCLSAAYNKPTSGILYFTCPVGAGLIDPSLFPLVPFFSRVFTNCGTQQYGYEKMAEDMDLYTGGITMSPFSGTYFSEQGGFHSFLALQGKALDRNVDKLFELILEFVHGYGFKDHERIKSLLLQYQAGIQASIVSTGHRYAVSLSARHLSKAAYINELWYGIAQYKAIQDIIAKIEDPITLDSLESDFTRIARALFRKGNFKPALVGSGQSILASEKNIERIYRGLPNTTKPAFHTPDIPNDTRLPNEGWYTNTAVSFVGQSFKAVKITHDDSPGLSVISKLLRSLYLHREIREKGGAYGGFAMYNTEEGIFSFGSYRDPHIKQTLDVYKSACDFIMKGEYTPTDVKEAILQVCSDIDKPETPGPAAMKAFYRDITRLSDEIRKHFKDELLRLDKNKIQQIAQNYFNIDDKEKGICVISSKERLEDANQALEKDNRPPLTLNKI